MCCIVLKCYYLCVVKVKDGVNKKQETGSRQTFMISENLTKKYSHDF